MLFPRLVGAVGNCALTNHKASTTRPDLYLGMNYDKY
jgi:hypothetical protein